MKLSPIGKNVQKQKYILPIMWTIILAGLFFGMILFNFFDYHEGLLVTLLFPIGVILHLYISRRLASLVVHTVDKDPGSPRPSNLKITIPRLKTDTNVKAKEIFYSSVLVAVLLFIHVASKDNWESQSGILFSIVLCPIIVYLITKDEIDRENKTIKIPVYKGPDLILEEDGISVNNELVVSLNPYIQTFDQPLVKIPWSFVVSVEVGKDPNLKHMGQVYIKTSNDVNIVIYRTDLYNIERKLIDFISFYSSAKIILKTELDTV